MIDYLDSAGDVLAVRIAGRLSRDEIMGIAARIEQSLDAREKTHIYAELADFQGFDWTVLGEYLPRALKMLGRRERFGRIAIVSDIAWVRWATRAESALLPGLVYETFGLNEREQALAWVEGRSPYPHGQALTLVETDDPDVFGFDLAGRIGGAEMHDLSRRIIALMEARPGKVRILGRFTDFHLPALAGLDADYVRMKRTALERVERYAVVGGPAWLAAWTEAVAPLVRMEVRHFPAEREAEAWQWLGASPREKGRSGA